MLKNLIIDKIHTVRAGIYDIEMKISDIKEEGLTYYLPNYFRAYELADEITYDKLGDGVYGLFDYRILYTIDRIRARFNRPITVNDWKSGGRFSERGWRSRHNKEGAEHSQHRFGRACDFDVRGISADEVRKEILDHQDHDDFKYITRMETGITWVHIDCKNVDTSKGIYLFKP